MIKITSTLTGITMAFAALFSVPAGVAAAQPLPCMWPLRSVEVGGVWACQDTPPIFHHNLHEHEAHRLHH